MSSKNNKELHKTCRSGDMTTLHIFTESSDESSSSDSSDSDSGEERDDGEGVKTVEWRPKGAQQALGQWEKHTTVS